MTIHHGTSWRTFLGLAVVLVSVSAGRPQGLLTLREACPKGYQYHVSTRVDLTGSLALPPDKGQTTPKTLPVTGESAIEYDERILALATDGLVNKTARIYRR